jgi:uncharacterized ParB-like nuclease family protein
LVRDIRFCQNTYLKPRIGGKLLKAVIDYANKGNGDDESTVDAAAFDELLTMLRTALGFYVEARKVEIGPKQEKMARRDSMTDAQQAMAMACQWIEENIDALGDAVVGTPIYNAVREKKRQEEYDREHREQAECRRRREVCEQNHRKLFTDFPATHRTPEHKI